MNHLKSLYQQMIERRKKSNSYQYGVFIIQADYYRYSDYDSIFMQQISTINLSKLDRYYEESGIKTGLAWFMGGLMLSLLAYSIYFLDEALVYRWSRY